MKVLLRFLNDTISETEKNISDDIAYRKSIESRCLSHKWAVSRINKNKRFLSQLNEAIKIINGATVKGANVCFKCQGTGQILRHSFAGIVVGSDPCDCQLKKNLSEL